MNLKHTKKRMVVLFGTTLLGLGLTACGGGSSSNDVSLTPAPAESKKVTIDASNQDEVVATTVKAIDQGNSFQSLPVLKSSKTSSDKILSKTINQPAFKKALGIAKNFKTLAASQSYTCTDGGSISVSGTQTSGTAVYSHCEEYGAVIDGTVSVSSNSEGTSGTATFTDFSMTLDGELSSYIKYMKYQYTYDTVHYKLSNLSITMEGYAITYGERTDFNNYKFTYAEDDNGNVDFTINGFVKNSCLGGWIEIKTLKTVHREEYSCPNKGEISVGGNGSELTVTFNLDQSADLSINGSPSEHYNSCDDLPSGICGI